tara:strand:+ start:741 stop:1031 length:291 start_codon:yes stop_codon:yes gene_type:complete
MCIESDELIVAFNESDDSNTNGDPVNTSPDVLAASVCVFNIVISKLAELSKTSKEIVGVLDVLLVTRIDLIIKVSLLPAVNNAVSDPVANATALNL